MGQEILELCSVAIGESIGSNKGPGKHGQIQMRGRGSDPPPPPHSKITSGYSFFRNMGYRPLS